MKLPEEAGIPLQYLERNTWRECRTGVLMRLIHNENPFEWQVQWNCHNFCFFYIPPISVNSFCYTFPRALSSTFSIPSTSTSPSPRWPASRVQYSRRLCHRARKVSLLVVTPRESNASIFSRPRTFLAQQTPRRDGLLERIREGGSRDRESSVALSRGILQPHADSCRLPWDRHRANGKASEVYFSKSWEWNTDGGPKVYFFLFFFLIKHHTYFETL